MKVRSITPELSKILKDNHFIEYEGDEIDAGRDVTYVWDKVLNKRYIFAGTKEGSDLCFQLTSDLIERAKNKREV